MAKKNKRNHFKDNNDSDASSHRGQGNWRGNGRVPPGGLGRGDSNGSHQRGGSLGGSERGNATPRGNSRGQTHQPYRSMNGIDVEIQRWQTSGSGFNSPRGRGGKEFSSNRGSAPTERGNFGSPRGGRGRGGRGGSARGSKSKLPLDAGHRDRPLLRPIVFVRSEHTATLFEQAEDILEPVGENTSTQEDSNVPTANSVTRVFSGGHSPLFGDLQQLGEEIQEVNYEDLGRLRDKVENGGRDELQQSGVAEVEQKLIDFCIDSQPSVHALQDPTNVNGEAEVVLPDGYHRPLIVMDDVLDSTMDGSDERHIPGPSLLVGGSSNPNAKTIATFENVIRAEHMVTDAAEPVESVLSMNEERDGASVVETWQGQANGVPRVKLPHTKSLSDILADDAGSVVNPQGEPSGSFYIDTQPTSHDHQEQITFDRLESDVPLGVLQDDEDDVIVYEAPNPRSSVSQVPAPSKSLATFADISFQDTPPVSSPRKINPLRRGTLFERVSKKGKGTVVRRRLSGRSSFRTFGAIVAEARLRRGEDQRKDERRMGDSDLDWGEESDDDTNLAAVAEGMDLDPDLVGTGVSTDALKRFVDSVSGEGSRFVTMDDLEDIQRMKEEEENDSTDDKDDENEELISEEEAMLAAEFGDEDSSEGSSDDELDEESSDDAEYNPRTGFQARLDKLRKRQTNFEDEDEDEEIEPDFKWMNQSDGEFIDDVQKFIDTINFKIMNRNMKINNRVAQAIRDGYFDDTEPNPALDRYKNLPPELREQWMKDKAKKAERKMERELERLIATMDPQTPKKGGNKSRKAMIAAAKFDPSIEIPNRIVDIVSVEKQIRRFLANNRRSTMALPAADKETRKGTHELANAFNLKSKSKGGANGRYTTLTKTKHSGFNISEKKVAGVLKRFKTGAPFGGSQWKGKGKGAQGQIKTREGEVVGHSAPKIDGANIGFKMLASMGWAEGDTIGLSGGLEAPIAAVIKKTKLGLGASKHEVEA